MENYLKTKKDEINFLRVLFRQIDADGVVSVREVGCIKAISQAVGISDENYEEAERLYKEEGVGDFEFSSIQASFLAMIAAFDISIIDLDFSDEEAAMLDKLQNELKIPADINVKDSDITALMVSYAEKYISTEKRFLALLDKIGPGIDSNDIGNMLPLDSDRKAFIKVLLRTSFADLKLLESENSYIYMMSRVFNIDDSMTKEAIKEFKNNPHEKLSFSQVYSTVSALREAVRLACYDNNFDEAEKNTILKIAEEAGADFSRDILDDISVIVDERIKVNRMKMEAIEFARKNI